MHRLFSFSLTGFPAALARRLPIAAVGLLLSTGLLDEIYFGLQEAAWPAIRSDLDMDYLLIGLVLAIPGIVSGVLEVGMGVAADTRLRKPLIIGGGVLLGGSVLFAAASVNGWMLLGATVLLYPASGAFVSLSQASLMDIDPERHQQNMARWTFVGSVGVVVGTLTVAGASELGISWRALFAAVGSAMLVVTVIMSRLEIGGSGSAREFSPGTMRRDLVGVWRSLRSFAVTRWLGILVFGDLMVDVLLGFIALYFVDVLDVSLTQAALAVSVWTIVGLIGDFALIPLLERFNGLAYLRLSALAVAGLFPAFLLTDSYWVAVAILGALGLLNAGWYSIPQGRLYSALPGRSGSVVSITSASAIFISLAPLGIGALATFTDLQTALWVLIVSPVALVFAVPRR